ncbi:MAG TPA: HD domain-containing phosphohydrolase [Bacteroidota bacterium]|nr:HD domain-containing phosphohydrolase [Bacteroidota bacterium]
MELSEKVRVLLVEDDPIQLKIASHLLGKKGLYDVITAGDAAEAFAAAKERKPALVISDFYLPGGDGLSLCQKIKGDQQLRSTMFMLLTAQSDLDQKIKALETGADDFISKPYNESEFLSRVQVLLRIKKLQDELQQDRDQLQEANKTLQGHFAGIVDLLAKFITLRVPNASLNAEKGARMARWMGERLHLEERDLHELELAARLHEIGKITIPDPLFKRHPDQLTDEEWRRFLEFPLLGETLLHGIPEMEEIAKLVRHQLENYDGSGFPDKLMGNEIHLSCRILRAVNYLEHATRADVTSAENQFDHLSKAKGTSLDPHIAQLLREYLQVTREPSWLEGKEEISILDLREGMVIASDICTGNGTKLLPRETKITRPFIERILAQHHFDPIINNIYVYKAE